MTITDRMAAWRRERRVLQFAEHRWQGQGVSVTITDRMAAWRRERRVLLRVSRAA